jgi:hypothetical protein
VGRTRPKRHAGEAEREDPDERFCLSGEVVAVEGDVAVMRVAVRCTAEREPLHRHAM